MVCVTDFPPVLSDHGDVVVVSAARKEITFTGKAKEALRLLLSGIPVQVEEVAVSTGVDAGALADVLMNEDICAEATPELISGYSNLAS